MTTELLDCTLRDGAYVNNGNFGVSAIKNVISNLNDAKIDIVECGWIKNEEYIEGSTYFSSLNDIYSYIPDKKNSKFSIMLYHDKYDLKKLPKDIGKIDIIREIFHKESFRKAVWNSEIIKDFGYELFYQAVDTQSYNNKELMELSGLINKIMPNCVYIVDTHGGMFREDLKRIFEILNENLDDKIKIGFHSHNNMQLSFSLSIDFIELSKKYKRNSILDATLFGMGRGAGNLNLELIAEYLNKFYFKKYDLDTICLLIKSEILKFREITEWGYSIPYLLTGSYMIHSRYAKYLTEKYDINFENLREILSKVTGKDRKNFNKEEADKILKKMKIELKEPLYSKILEGKL